MVYDDSALVIRHVNKDWDCNNEKMDAYIATIRKLENKFYGLEFHHVLRADNQAADALSKVGSTRAEIPHGVFVEDLLKPSIEEEDKPEVDKPPAD
jgi:ribonuclease HI